MSGRLVLVLLVLLATGVFLGDLYVIPGAVLPGPPYALAIIIAAYFLPPGAVAAVAVYAVALHVLAYWLEEPSLPWQPALYVVATALFGGFGVALSHRTKREADARAQVEAQREQLRGQAAQLQAQSEELQVQNEELRVANEASVQAQRALSEAIQRSDAQREFLDTVVQNAPAGIAVLRAPDFVFEIFNAAYRAIAPGKEMLGRTVADVWPEISSQVLPLLEGVVSTCEPYHAVDMPLLIHRFPGKPAEEGFFTFSYMPLGLCEGKAEQVLVLVVETTEQVRARQRVEELAEAAQRQAAELQAVLDNMVDGVFVCDAQGRITLVNEAGVGILGLSTADEVKRALSESPDLLRVRRLDGRPVASADRPLARSLQGQTVVLADHLLYNAVRGRDIYVRTNAAPIRNETGTIVGAVAVMRDITELIELDKMKDGFIAVAAHELKTPVAIMKGYAQALLRPQEGASERQRKMLEAIDRGSNRIDGVVGDMLDISRLHVGRLELERERIDLAAAISEIIDRMALTHSTHRLRLVSEDPAVVYADRGRLEQVIVNLLDNAIKYSPNGCDVDVSVAVQKRQAVVSVTDHGVGIPKEKQRRIFQRFYRAHDRTPYDYGGMGVGLYISNEIVARHGGRMWFESEQGTGSTFYFTLPLAQDQQLAVS